MRVIQTPVLDLAPDLWLPLRFRENGAVTAIFSETTDAGPTAALKSGTLAPMTLRAIWTAVSGAQPAMQTTGAAKAQLSSPSKSVAMLLEMSMKRGLQRWNPRQKVCAQHL